MSLELEVVEIAHGDVKIVYTFRRFLLDWLKGGNVWELTFIWRGLSELPGFRLRVGRLQMHVMYSCMSERGSARGFSIGYIDHEFHFWVLHPL